jgi:hypothetical protein
VTSGVVDEALERLHATADEFRGGLSNHGPMVVDALVRLGAPAEVLPWCRRYERHLEPDLLPPPPPIEDDWRDAVRAEVPALLRGAAAAAGHGAIRTGHAVALLEDEDTGPRRVELARALRYWRQTYAEVAVGPTLVGASSVRAALGRVASLTPPAPGPGLISDRLRALGAVPGYAAPIDEVVDAAAAALLASARRSTIALVHAVTTPVALQALSPYVAGVEAEAWFVAAALISAYADALDVPKDELDSPSPVALEDAVGRAIESGDEHAIKLAAACAGRAAGGDPVHAAVIGAVATRLTRGR